MPRRFNAALLPVCALVLAFVVQPAQASGVAPVGARPADWTVYAFSQSEVSQQDPQIYRLDPDVNIRAFQKWSTHGTRPGDYDFGQIGRYHRQRTAFVGGGTVSVIFAEEFADAATFDDMSTRDADNVPVPHDEVVPGARRGTLFNPAYREYLLDWAKVQIDGGVDGLFFDEVISGFSGGQKYGFNGNEGFDDYAIADFTRYLLAKYPAFTPADWQSRFGMTGTNLPRADVPADDLAHNFDYRAYLLAGGWNKNPLTPANPLAAEWGDVTDNRLYAEDTSFTATYLRRYWKSMVDELRAYDRRVLITSNGLLPYVDVTSVGMYPWNPDEQTPDGRGVDYVPTVDGHLNGAKSLQGNYRYLVDRNRRIAGNVPVVVFIDWPTDMMTAYLNLPLSEKQDYWRIFGAEAYANGLFPALHLRDTVGSPTAADSGMLPFFQTYARFFREHANLFRANDYSPREVRVGVGNVSAGLLVQSRTGARTVHLVNHNYDRGVTPQTDFTVRVDVRTCPARVSMVSPDFPGSRSPAFSCRHGRLAVTVDRLDYYDVLVLR